MYWRGLFISLASLPGWTSISIPAGWAALSCCLPQTLWRVSRHSTLHTFLYAFMAYALLSALWAPDVLNVAWRVWWLFILWLSFHYGSTLESLEEVWKGMAIGGAISSAVGVAQWFGFPYIMHFSTSDPAGLHYNQTVQGMVLVLTCLALWSERLWLWSLPLLPGIWLSHARGAYLVLAAGFILRFNRMPALILTIGMAAVFYASLGRGPNDIERIRIWVGAAQHFSPFGIGLGSFTNFYMINDGRVVQPENAHNDFIQLIFEFGLGAIPFFVLWLVAATQAQARCWLVVAGVSIFAFFNFPIFSPLPLFMFALCAGHISRSWNPVWAGVPNLRRRFLPRPYGQEQGVV